MKRFSRRSFLHCVAAIPTLGMAKSAIRAADLPPGHPPRAPLGEVAVTKDMKVTLSARSGDFVYFEGKALEIKASVATKPGERKDKVPAEPFGSKDIAKLPGGEFTFDGVPLSDAESKHWVVVRIEEVHCPGISVKLLEKYFETVEQGRIGGPAPAMLIKVDGGGSLWLDELLDGLFQFCRWKWMDAQRATRPRQHYFQHHTIPHICHGQPWGHLKHQYSSFDKRRLCRSAGKSIGMVASASYQLFRK